MSDYIKRNDVLNSIEELKKSPWYNDDYGFGIKQARHDSVNIVIDLCIKEIPSSDVKEIVHAKWEWFNAWEGDNTFNEWITLRCSNCLESEGARENAKYCPNCGAKMNLK